MVELGDGGPGGVWPDGSAGSDVADEQWEPEQAGKEASAEAGDDNEDEVGGDAQVRL